MLELFCTMGHFYVPVNKWFRLVVVCQMIVVHFFWNTVYIFDVRLFVNSIAQEVLVRSFQ